MTKTAVALLALGALGLLGCDEMSGEADRRRDAEERAAVWNGPCADKSWLLATTTGSPNFAQCPNKAHRMHVQISTTPSNEEIGALVFCQCERGDATDAGVGP